MSYNKKTTIFIKNKFQLIGQFRVLTASTP